MNNFKHKKTIITESQFEFSKLEDGISFSGEVMMSVSIAIPKDPEVNRLVLCTIDLSLGKETDKVRLRVVSQSSFDIVGIIEKATLQQDVQEQCYPEAAKITKEKIAEITCLHVETPLVIPIPLTLSDDGR